MQPMPVLTIQANHYPHFFTFRTGALHRLGGDRWHVVFRRLHPKLAKARFVFFFTLLAPSSSTAKSLESLVPLLPLLELGHGKASSQGTGKGATLADEDGADFALTLQGILPLDFQGRGTGTVDCKGKGLP